MRRLLVSGLLTIGICMASTSANASGANDYITGVYACDSNHISLLTQNEGWVIILTQDVGQTDANWMLSVALTLLTTGKKVGGFYEPNPSTQINDGCGHNGYEITTLYATASS